MRKQLLTIGFLLLAPFVQAQDNPKIKMATNHGDLVIELYPNQAPITVANFLRYVDEGFYDNTQFHRVIRGFVIQGGGFNTDMVQKPTHEPIKNESDNGLRNSRGTLSMARRNAPDSASSQFFINLTDNPNLDGSGNRPGYAVFGKVVEGMQVVDEIAQVPTQRRAGHRDVPTEPVVVSKASRLNTAAAQQPATTPAPAQ